MQRDVVSGNSFKPQATGFASELFTKGVLVGREKEKFLSSLYGGDYGACADLFFRHGEDGYPSSIVFHAIQRQDIELSFRIDRRDAVNAYDAGVVEMLQKANRLDLLPMYTGFIDESDDLGKRFKEVVRGNEISGVIEDKAEFRRSLVKGDFRMCGWLFLDCKPPCLPAAVVFFSKECEHIDLSAGKLAGRLSDKKRNDAVGGMESDIMRRDDTGLAVKEFRSLKTNSRLLDKRFWIIVFTEGLEDYLDKVRGIKHSPFRFQPYSIGDLTR